MKSLLFLAAFAAGMTVYAKENKLVLYSNGKVQYEYEVEGYMFQGKFSSYYESGKLRMKGQFIQNQKTGLWRVWDEKGLLRSERNYSGNLNFTLLHQWDSSGARILPQHDAQGMHTHCGFTDRLFSYRYINSIEADVVDNQELFETGGFVNSLLLSIRDGSALALAVDQSSFMASHLNRACYEQKDVVALLFKEEYFCCATDQNMKNNLLGVCPVVMENGKRKELGWFYIPEFAVKKEVLQKISDHQYASTIVKTTANESTYRFRAVNSQENDRLRLMLVEYEANAILYTIDQQFFVQR